MGVGVGWGGFGVMGRFMRLFYEGKGWEGGGLGVRVFRCGFVGRGLLLGKGIKGMGGLKVGMIWFRVEIMGVVVVGVGSMGWMGKMGVLVGGGGFWVVLGGLGVVGVKGVGEENEGGGVGS